MRIAEEFDRCEECGAGWFKVERRVLIQKGSPSHSPVHYTAQDCYICTKCNHQQYSKTVEED